MSRTEPLDHLPQPGGGRAIPCLDGLRALSIGMVLAGHSMASLAVTWQRLPGLAFTAPLAEEGVGVFFVISGFLITRLLLGEIEGRGNIRLGRFYRRRALRILPAYYAYVSVLLVLWAAGWVQQHPVSLLSAGAYFWNYYPHATGSTLGNVWSLCVEEQFYLIWPAILAVAGRRRGTAIAIAGIAVAPVSRVATYVLWPSMRGHVPIMFHTRADTLLFGCLLALLWDDAGFQGELRRWFRAPRLASAVVFLLLFSPWATIAFRGRYLLPVGYSLNAAAMTFLIAFLVLHPQGWAGRILNTRVMRHIGVLSYSLYVWQQLAMFGPWSVFPLNLLIAVLAAEASLHWIERPALRWRDRIEDRGRAVAAASRP